ncbi:MAG: DUF1700 domain-containing protein [Oscillospiraceae bacterium]|nr:DUF1700 domain-containing protein [Oscillospiraceae bacterium]
MMTKNEFLSALECELKKNGIEDTTDILGEYVEHFAFKLADGFTEEEIAKKLGKPSELASQFENEKPNEKRGGRKFTTVIGLMFTDFFASICMVLLWAWEVVMAAATVGFAALAACLICRLNYRALIPPMPYWCGVIFGLSCAALTILSAVGCIYFAAYLRQLIRAFARFNQNAMASASGRPVLPPIPTYPQLPAKRRRTLRQFALISLAAFAICFVLGMIVSMLSAQALGFWHAWGWFGYTFQN